MTAITSRLSRRQQKAPRERLEFPISSFDGVDNNNDPASIKDSVSPDALNVNYDSVGAIQSRKGYIKLLTTTLANPITGMRSATKSDQVTRQLVYASGTDWYVYNNAGGSTKISTQTFTTGRQWDFDQFADKVYGVNGADGVYQYDFSTVTSIPGWGSGTNSSGQPQYIRVHKNRVWLAGDPTNPSRLYFSDPNAASAGTFPINNFIDINSNDGQVITGLEVLLDALIVFKGESIWMVLGEPVGSGNVTLVGNLSLRKANSEVGCVAFRTIAKVESILFFMHQSGLYVFQNNQAKRISDNVNTTFRNMNPNFQYLSWGHYSKVEKKYLLGYPSSIAVTPDSTLVYDTITRQFVPWDDTPGGCAVTFQFNKTDAMLVGDPVKGIIYQWFNGFADIAGDNGIATGGSTTTIVDSSKAWSTDQFKDAKVYISAGPGIGQTAVVSSNTATTLTFPAIGTAAAVGSTYTLGGFTSYWTSKVFDFGMPQMTKKYKYLNLFLDSQANYNLLVGFQAGDAVPVTSFNAPAISLYANATGFDSTYAFDSSLVFDAQSQIFKRANIGQQGRFIQLRFGTRNGNQKWRCFDYSISYKLKKARPI